MRTNSIFVNLFFAVMAINLASCKDWTGLTGELPEPGNDTTTVVRHDTVTEKVPMFFDVIGKDTILLDEDGVRTNKHQDCVVAILKAVPSQITVDADNQWRLREESATKAPSYEWVGGSCSWQYNHGTVETVDSVYAIYKGRKLPLWKPERLRVTQNTLKVSEYGAYGTKADVEYSLSLEGAVLAKATQKLMTEPGFVDEFLYGKVLEVKHNVGTAVWLKSTNCLQCTDSVKIGQVWASGIKNIVWKAVHSTNYYDVQITGQTVANLNAVIGQSWTGSQAKFDNLQININWLRSEFVEKSLPVTVSTGATVEVIDSLKNHQCNWPVKGGKVLSAKKVRVDFVRQGEPIDNYSNEFDVNIKQRTIIDVIYSFLHKTFVKKATVSGKNLTVKCDNGSKFQPKFDDNTLGEVVEGNFLETLTFNLSHPDYVSSAAKGKTYSVGSDGRVTIEGQVWSITFASRTIGSISYNGKEYKNDPKVPQCMATPTTIYFCSDCDSVEYTLKHESEIIKGREKVTYNFVVDYEVKEEHHDTWGQISSSNGTWTLPCSNYVLVVPIYKDGTRGQAEKLDYTAYNTWKMTKMLQAEVVNPTDYIGTTVQIVDGKATVAGLGESILGHTMAANKVTKGSWSYQPGNCPADATYFTIVSTTEARVDVYHDSKKIREFLVPISLVQKLLPIIINGEIIRIDCTHAYQNQHGSYEGTYWHILARLADGSYIDYVIREESYNKNLSLQQNMTQYKLTASDGKLIVDSGEAVALIWTGFNWVVGTVTSEEGKAAVGFYIEYHYQGQLAYTLGNGTGTHSQGNKGFPNAILGSWTQPSADGTWPITIAGNTYNLRGE